MKNLKLEEEYKDLFEKHGYFSCEDVENLKALTKDKLKDMGIIEQGKQDFHCISCLESICTGTKLAMQLLYIYFVYLRMNEW